MRNTQWIEITYNGKKTLIPTNGLVVAEVDGKCSLYHVPDFGDGSAWDSSQLKETYEQMRRAIERVGGDEEGSIICADPTDTVLKVPDLTTAPGIE